ncbi:substance-K receptor-like [Acropora palmata]|uniref:substance-K receptor-like n=1 Tax=Acropora palmata TaxID=6131 RepID=UPI003DA17C1B
MPNNSSSSNVAITQPSQSAGGTCLSRPFTETEKWLQVSSFLLIVVVSIFGNTIVIYIIKKNRRLHSSTNYFILNLCAANLMIMVLNTSPDILGRIAPHLGFVVGGLAGTILCKLQGFLALCTVNAAILTLAVIAADRFIAIFFPMRRAISSRTAIWLIAASWVAPALPSSLFLYVYRLFDFDGTLYCLEQWSPAIPLYINTIYSTVDIILFYALPLVEIIIFYGAIIYKIWMRKIPGQATSVNQQLELKAKKSVLKVLITAVLTFALFWLPTKILTVIALIGDVPCIMRSPLIRFVNLFLACMNCAINPLIYLIFSRDYRNGFKASFHCCRRLGCDFSHTHAANP